MTKIWEKFNHIYIQLNFSLFHTYYVLYFRNWRSKAFSDLEWHCDMSKTCWLLWTDQTRNQPTFWWHSKHHCGSYCLWNCTELTLQVTWNIFFQSNLFKDLENGIDTYIISMHMKQFYNFWYFFCKVKKYWQNIKVGKRMVYSIYVAFVCGRFFMHILWLVKSCPLITIYNSYS